MEVVVTTGATSRAKHSQIIITNKINYVVSCQLIPASVAVGRPRGVYNVTGRASHQPHGSRFTAVTKNMDWNSAAQYCRNEYGGHLMEIGSQAEQQELVDYLSGLLKTTLLRIVEKLLFKSITNPGDTSRCY